MEWYWWIIIGAAVIAIGAFKIWYVPKWLKRMSDKKAKREKLMEDDD